MGLNFLTHVVSVPPDNPRIAQPKNAKIKQGEIDIDIEMQSCSGVDPLHFVSLWKNEVLIDSSCER